MSLSQDEIDALTADLGEDDPESGGDIMSPEAMTETLEGVTGADLIEEKNAEVEESHGDPFAAKALEGMLTDEEIDILGEVGNISMGAVATTMYALLDRRVDITTPCVSVYDTKDVLSVYQIPFVVATIEYTRGIAGTNLLVLRIDDVLLITDLLMGGDGATEQPIELNEMHISAMSEIMNQMMGASSTSLSKLLGKSIDIAPPKSSQVDAGYDVKEILGDMDKVIKISFDMEIEGLLKSELIQLVPYDVGREFAKQFMEAGVGGAPESETAPPTAEVAPQSPPPMPAQPVAETPSVQHPYPPQTQAAQHPYPPQTPYPQQSHPYPPPVSASMAGQNRVVDVHPMQFQSFDQSGVAGDSNPIGLVYNIPLQVSVELGKAKKEISEILEFNLGTIIVLDKSAGDPVEIVVNGKTIAQGEVVVIDDNYGVRITEIINS